MAFFKRAETTATSGPEAQAGGPVYDARVDPLVSIAQPGNGERLLVQSELHHFGSAVAPAQAYSHYYEPSPNPATLQIMGLARERDLLEEQTMTRRAQHPFPGVHLGPVPAFAAAANPQPVLAGTAHLRTHTAHQVESKRQTRARFGHG